MNIAEDRQLTIALLWMEQTLTKQAIVGTNNGDVITTVYQYT